VFGILCIVATPFVFTAWLVHRLLEHRSKLASLRLGARMGAQLGALPPAAHPCDVEQRIANLEAIVASLDFDLAVKLRETGRAA
jgi:hypothetical protein